MKVYEVLTGPDLVSRVKNRQKTKHSEWQELYDQLTRMGVKGKELGDGLFSVVIDHGHDPGTVQKVAYGMHGGGYTAESLLKDAYFNYLIKIAQHGMDWNPYLPKVYDVKFYESKDGSIGFVLEMEKLHDFSTLNKKEALAMGRRIFGDEFADHMEERFAGDSDPSKTAETLQKFIVSELEQWMRGNRNPKQAYKIQDSRLRHAMAVASKAMRHTPDAFPDVHSGNVMLRRSPYGAQLVLIDPIAD